MLAQNFSQTNTHYQQGDRLIYIRHAGPVSKPVRTVGKYKH
jgi:hypothetical protein